MVFFVTDITEVGQISLCDAILVDSSRAVDVPLEESWKSWFSGNQKTPVIFRASAISEIGSAYGDTGEHITYFKGDHDSQVIRRKGDLQENVILREENKDTTIVDEIICLSENRIRLVLNSVNLNINTPCFLSTQGCLELYRCEFLLEIAFSNLHETADFQGMLSHFELWSALLSSESSYAKTIEMKAKKLSPQNGSFFPANFCSNGSYSSGVICLQNLARSNIFHAIGFAFTNVNGVGEKTILRREVQWEEMGILKKASYELGSATSVLEWVKIDPKLGSLNI